MTWVLIPWPTMLTNSLSTINTGLVNQEIIIQEKYLAILEKTNDQLSLRNNPYWIMIGILSILIAFLAIWVAFYIYKQSRDYKHQLYKQQSATNENYKQTLNWFLEWQEKIIKEKNERYEEIGKNLENLISKYEKKLSNTASKGEEEIKKTLSDLKKEKEKILSENYIPTVKFSPRHDIDYLWLNNRKVIKCTNCSHSFYAEVYDRFWYQWPIGAYSSILDSSEAMCPYCWTKCYVW